MEAKAVKRQATPRYPTRLEVLADRSLLEKHMPAAWRSCAEMAGAVTILLTANNCLAQHPYPAHAGTKAIVAPIFEHGEGRGATGCVVVNPPVFLSEQDAMQVIREELLKSGVTLSEASVKLSDIFHLSTSSENVTVRGSTRLTNTVGLETMRPDRVCG